MYVKPAALCARGNVLELIPEVISRWSACAYWSRRRREVDVLSWRYVVMATRRRGVCAALRGPASINSASTPAAHGVCRWRFWRRPTRASYDSLRLVRCQSSWWRILATLSQCPVASSAWRHLSSSRGCKRRIAFFAKSWPIHRRLCRAACRGALGMS